jgi:hypothetical protein
MMIDYWCDTYQIVKCRGCDTRSFRQTNVNSEDRDPETGQPEEHVTEYPGEPPRESSDPPTFYVRAVKPFRHVPDGPRRIYVETVEAFNRELYTLAGGGVRAIIEAICSEKQISDGPVEAPDGAGGVRIERKKDLRAKIAGLADAGILTKQHAELLHEHRFLGNNALHELRAPSAEHLDVAIDIVEHTLENIYEVAHKAAELTRARTAGRPPGPPRAAS